MFATVSHIMRVRTRVRLLELAMLGAIVLVGFASNSGTACVTILIVIALDRQIALLRRKGGARLIGIGLLLINTPLTVWLLLYPTSLLDLLGKDPTLTGRTELWEYVITYINQRPAIGWGGAFRSDANPAANEISNALGWGVTEAYSGLLELLQELGHTSTSIFALLFVRTIYLGVRNINYAASDPGITTLPICASIASVGVTELVPNDPSEPAAELFSIAGFLCERAVKAAGRRPLTLNRAMFRRDVVAGI
jgi:exopolysaccharide production protein ExoQ